MSFGQDIQAAFCTRIANAALSKPIAWPLVKYTPVSGQAYFAVHPLLRASVEHIQIAFSGPNINRGIFQVDAVIPDSAGESLGLQMADAIQALFPIGTVLDAGSAKLRIVQPPNNAAAVMDAPWVRYPVSVPYLVIN